VVDVIVSLLRRKKLSREKLSKRNLSAEIKSVGQGELPNQPMHDNNVFFVK